MSRRTQVKDVEPSAAESSVAPEAVKPDELKAALDNLRTQIDGIDSRLRSMDEKMRPVDLGKLEEKVSAASLEVGVLRKSLTNVEGELRRFNAVFKVVLGVGVVGIILMIGVILRLAHYI